MTGCNKTPFLLLLFSRLYRYCLSRGWPLYRKRREESDRPHLQRSSSGPPTRVCVGSCRNSFGPRPCLVSFLLCLADVTDGVEDTPLLQSVEVNLKYARFVLEDNLTLIPPVFLSDAELS